MRLIVEEISAKWVSGRGKSSEVIVIVAVPVAGNKELSQTLSNVLISGIRSLLQAQKVGSIVSAPSTQLSHVLL